MLVSVVVKTKDQASRLRLVLASLVRQSAPVVPAGSRVADDALACEVVVTDDGSTDATPAVLTAARADLPLTVVRHEHCRGRSAAANAGARQATGDLLLFLDGDTLLAPTGVALHAARQRRGPVVGRGETYHLRCTRFFLDPETGTPQPGHEEHVRKLGAELHQHLVTRAQVLDDFSALERRSQPGIYPGGGPRQLFELEWRALHEQPDLEVLWMTAAGHNLSVPRADFLAVGGFHEGIDNNEHRELALRLQARGLRVAPVAGARSYHLTHQVGWRNPLTDTGWERAFYAAHPCLAVKLMSLFWLSLARDPGLPPAARIDTLEQFAAVVRQGASVDYDAVRRRYPQLADLA